MPIIKVDRIDRRNSNSTWLSKYLSNTYSQIGQDGVLQKCIEILELDEKCLSVEFGAWDGIYLSNTASLIKKNNWNGIFIEANVAKFAELAKNYSDEIASGRVTAINQFVHLESGKGTLDEIIKKTGWADVNFLSIDIDGNDIYILNALKMRPELLLIEFNPSIQNDTVFIQDRDPVINQGSSLKAIIAAASKIGYDLIYAFNFDALFVRSDKFEKFAIEDNSIDSMYMPFKDNRFVQCYDGTIYIDGCRRLLWKGVEFGIDELQLLPKKLRSFNDNPA